MGITVESALSREIAAERQGGGAPLTASGRTADQPVTGPYPSFEEKDDATHRQKG
jgi:hypothetical protein